MSAGDNMAGWRAEKGLRDCNKWVCLGCNGATSAEQFPLESPKTISDCRGNLLLAQS